LHTKKFSSLQKYLSPSKAIEKTPQTFMLLQGIKRKSPKYLASTEKPKLWMEIEKYLTLYGALKGNQPQKFSSYFTLEETFKKFISNKP